jgi:hypothetical protein
MLRIVIRKGKNFVSVKNERPVLTFYKVVLAPLNFIPFLGLGISAWMKALSTARSLHSPVSCGSF